jgi:alpha-N-arabinofuranosidase
MTLLRHADRVAIACLAQLVNVIGPIRSEPGGPSWRQTTFHPFALTAQHARGTVLRTEVSGPVVETDKHGPVPAIDTVSTLDQETGGLTVLAVNRDQEQTLGLRAALRGLGKQYRVVEHLQIADADPDAANTEAEPDRVTPQPVRETAVNAEGELEAALPPVSWNLIRLAPKD